MALHEQLKQLRVKAGISQEQAARRFDVSVKTVSRWETGESVPSLDILSALREIYQLSDSELGSLATLKEVSNG